MALILASLVSAVAAVAVALITRGETKANDRAIKALERRESRCQRNLDALRRALVEHGIPIPAGTWEEDEEE